MESRSHMSNSSHILNFAASKKIRNVHADTLLRSSYNPNMARRGIPKGPVIWFLREWMQASNVATQAQMSEKTGWSKAKMSQLYNFQQDINSEILLEAAQALNVRPYELLLHPDDAHAIRQMRKTALQLAADERSTFIPEPDFAGDSERRKAG